MVLESMFEKQFEDSSHGFRPHRSCHTALQQVQRLFTATKWFIEGDIQGFFDNINHDVMIRILEERISDDRFIRLIRKFLTAGYLEEWVYHRTFSGTPQGGIVSPILANIYLDKLDKYMKEYMTKFDKGKQRTVNTEYRKLCGKRSFLVYKMKKATDETQRLEHISRIRVIEKERRQVPPMNDMDSNYRRIKYVRYADDFVIGVIGSRKDCEIIKEDIKKFLIEKLKLSLSDDKTLITHANKRAKFLGYEIYISKSSNQTKRGRISGILRRDYGKKVVLKLPMETMRKKLMDCGALKLINHNGHEKWKPQMRNRYKNNDDLEILDAYNAEIRGFCNFYSIANNSSELHNFRYIMEYSMYKTFASKYNTTMGKILAKYKINKEFTIFYESKKGEKKKRVLFKASFKRKKESLLPDSDNIPTIRFAEYTTSLIERLKAQQCELCGANGTLEMHHVRKVKDLNGKERWKILMIARRRKTMAVCQECHWKIHAGKID
jgi:group II intron reverse transcriptase/maturase